MRSAHPVSYTHLFRRWLLHSNPELTDFITSFIGDGFKKDAEELKKLNTPVITKNLKQLYRLLDIKAQKKAALADYLEKTQGITINPDSIFDIQIKRLHEYKRQQMNAAVSYTHLDVYKRQHTHYIIQLQTVLHTFDPPAVMILLMISPVIQRISPKLACC